MKLIRTYFLPLPFLLLLAACRPEQPETGLPDGPGNVPAASTPGRFHDVATLNIHDPCILPDEATGYYYVYANYSPKREWDVLESPHGRAGVKAYRSRDLRIWEGPFLVFEVPEDFWADRTDAPWAPEVNVYRGKYYLFVTFNDWDTIIDDNPGRPRINRRASQILVGDSPLGPFEPFANHPHTPDGEMTLDATLFVDEAGDPWMVYCHEWVQTTTGLIKAIRLAPDLSATVGEPITLMAADEVPWTKRVINYRGTPTPGSVTDGPFLYRSPFGPLFLLWSSWSLDRAYTTALVVSKSGRLEGPWEHVPDPLLWDDRGHGNLFRTFEGELRLAVHRYFHQPDTRMQIWAIEESADGLRIGAQLLGAE